MMMYTNKLLLQMTANPNLIIWPSSAYFSSQTHRLVQKQIKYSVNTSTLQSKFGEEFVMVDYQKPDASSTLIRSVMQENCSLMPLLNHNLYATLKCPMTGKPLMSTPRAIKHEPLVNQQFRHFTSIHSFENGKKMWNRVRASSGSPIPPSTTGFKSIK